MDDTTTVIRGMPNWRALGPDALPAELLKLGHPEFIWYFHNLLVKVWRMVDAPYPMKYETIEVLKKKKDRSERNNFRGNTLVAYSEKGLPKMVASSLSNY